MVTALPSIARLKIPVSYNMSKSLKKQTKNPQVKHQELRAVANTGGVSQISETPKRFQNICHKSVPRFMSPEIENRFSYKHLELTEKQNYKLKYVKTNFRTFVGELNGKSRSCVSKLNEPPLRVGLETLEEQTQCSCDPSPTQRGESGITRETEQRDTQIITDLNIQIPGEIDPELVNCKATPRSINLNTKNNWAGKMTQQVETLAETGRSL